MTRSELRTRILHALNENSTSPVFWSTSQLDAIVQDAQEVLAEEADAIKRTALTVLRPGTTYYATRGIAPDLMLPYRLWLPSHNRRLTAVTLGQLDAYHERWPTVTGTPESWFPMGWDWFGVFPHPTDGGGILRIDYLAWPREMDDDSDWPEFAHADQDALVLYGVYDGLLKRWDATQALVLFAHFMERLGKAVAKTTTQRTSARTWQKERASTDGFRSGVGRR